jgi:hypothetical protein
LPLHRLRVGQCVETIICRLDFAVQGSATIRGNLGKDIEQ